MATKRSNIFDPIQKNLDQKIYNGITPRPRVVKFITDEMQKVLTPILGFDPLEFMDLYLTGSLTTYQYSETSDCDISVFIKWDMWPTGEDPNTIRRKIIPVVMNKLDGSNVPGTEHPIQHFVVPPGTEPHDLYKPGLRSAWSFRDHKWIVPPEKDRVHDISVELPVLYSRAELMADKMETLLQVNPIYAKQFWHQIHRKRTMDQQAGLGDFSEGNIVYKYLLHNGYFDRIRDELGEKISKVTKVHVIQGQDPYGDRDADRAPLLYHPETDQLFIGQVGSHHGLVWEDFNKRLGEMPPYNELIEGDFYPKPIPQYNIPARWVIYDPADPASGARQPTPEEGIDMGMAMKFHKPLPVYRGNNQFIAKQADWDENFDMSTYDQYLPPVGSIWTISDPWALTRNPPGPATRTIQVEDTEGRYIWYRDLDTQTGKDQRDGMSVNMWNDKMHRGIIWQRGTEWSFQESPEEAAGNWPDTLPENWSMVREAATQRLFLAYELPPEIVQQVMQWQQENLPEGVYPEPATNLHMTIAFLGDTDETMIPHLQQILAKILPSSVVLSGPIEYRELDKLAFLALEDNGGNEVVEQLNEQLNQLMGYEPQFRPWLPHITVWRFGPNNKPNLNPALPNFGSFSPVGVNVYTSVRNPTGKGGIYQKVADDLSWVDKSTPYGTPAGGVVTGPEHWGDDSIDLPSEPGRDLKPLDNENIHDPKGSLKVIYDFERDQIILGDVKKADQFPPGQIIGDYRDGDVYLNAHAEAWFNANYFKRLWQHSFPKRPIRHVILDKGHGQHEVVHRHPTSAILPGHEDLHLQEEGTGSREEAREAAAGAQEDLVWPEDWESVDNISQAAVDNHQGYRDPGLIMGAIGNVKMQRMYGAHGDIFDTAANLIGKVQRQQAVVEGNKRTATLLGLNFLEENGFDTQPLAREGVWQQLVNLVYNLSDSSEESVEALANFLREHLNG
jgi:2'-5' RNA ligase